MGDQTEAKKVTFQDKLERSKKNLTMMMRVTIDVFENSLGFGITGASIGGTWAYIQGLPVSPYLFSVGGSCSIAAVGYFSSYKAIRSIRKKEDMFNSALAGTLTGSGLFGLWGGRKHAIKGGLVFSFCGAFGYFLRQQFLHYRDLKQRERFLLAHPEEAKELKALEQVDHTEAWDLSSLLPRYQVSDEEIEKRILKKLDNFKAHKQVNN